MNIRTHKYWIAGKEGRDAHYGERCPYGSIDLGARCQWLAAHYDKYGFEAWKEARKFTSTEGFFYEEKSN